MLVLLASAPISCGFPAQNDEFIGESEHPVLTTKTLGADVPISCDLRAGRFVNDPDTQFTIQLNAGDMVWVAGDAPVEYSEFGSFDSTGNSTIEDVLTYLSCRAGTTPDPGTTERPGLPHAANHQSRTSQNLWATGWPAPTGNLAYTHKTRAIYTASSGGTHICWMTYACINTGTNTPGEVTFKGTSTLKYYSSNQYPGTSWNQPTDVNCAGIPATGVAGCEVVNDPVTGEPASHDPQVETWDAGTRTSADSEVVVIWSPGITNCIQFDNDEAGVDERCDGLMATNTDTSFRWRLAVYQRNNGTTCNKALGEWSSPVACEWRTHHCDADIYTEVFPIVTEEGNEGDCGTSTANRNFKVIAQIRKADGEDNDLVVEHGTYSNLMIYTR
jgi:hypothetical protein